MSSINPSNSITLQSVIPLGKRPSDPNASPLQSAHNNTIQSTGGSDHAAKKKVASMYTDLLRGADPSDEMILNDRAAARTPQELKALDTAEKLIATTLIKPILAQARATRDAPAPWGQTQAEKQFGALLDNRIADDIAKATSFPIAQRIADQILQNTPIDTNPTTPIQTPIQTQYNPVDLFG